MSLRRSVVPLISALGAVIALAGGCTIKPSAGENLARDHVAQIGEILQPANQQRLPPSFSPDSPLGEYTRFALLNHPQIRAAYLDWQSAVIAIAPTRALPDPQVTFEADIVDTLMSFMPGLMFDVMTPGKRAAMAREMTAAGDVAYRGYVIEVLKVAAQVRKAWIELGYIDEAIRLNESSVTALKLSLETANADYSTGRSMGTLANQVRVTNDIAKVRSELASLLDRRDAARIRFKSSLGLAPLDHNPAWPRVILDATALGNEDQIWHNASLHNAELTRMRAMVEMAIATVDVASKQRTPDFTLGGMVDLKANPLMLRPNATMSLPLWREKISANIDAAKARQNAGNERINAEQLNLAAEIAQMLYMVREADRMIAFIDETALPNFDHTIATIAAGYQSGMTGPGMIPETQLTALAMRLERAAALREREIAATELLLLTAEIVPADAPLVADLRDQP